MAAGADKFYPAGLGETILLETAELPKLINSTLRAASIPDGVDFRLEIAKKRSIALLVLFCVFLQSLGNGHSPLMRLGETLAQRRFVVRVGARKTRCCVR